MTLISSVKTQQEKFWGLMVARCNYNEWGLKLSSFKKGPTIWSVHHTKLSNGFRFLGAWVTWTTFIVLCCSLKASVICNCMLSFSVPQRKREESELHSINSVFFNFTGLLVQTCHHPSSAARTGWDSISHPMETTNWKASVLSIKVRDGLSWDWCLYLCLCN